MATVKSHSNDDLSLPVTNHSRHYGSTVTKRGAYAASSYMTCALLLLMFNKAVLSSYAFPCVNVITLFQMASSCLLLYTMRYWKVISFSNDEQGHIQTNPVSIVPFRKWLHTIPVAVAYLLYMLASMESVRGISVPMYTTLRRTSVVFTMVMEYILVGQKHSRLVIFSVAIIILGALVAGAWDMSFDAYSYAVVLVSNICSAIYLSSVACIGKSNSLNSFGLMWCNGLLCGPILLFWTFTNGDLEVTKNFPYLLSPGFSGGVGIFLYTRFFIELLRILKHDNKFTIDTNNLWQLKGSFHNGTWVASLWWPALRFVKHHSPDSRFSWNTTLCLL